MSHLTNTSTPQAQLPGIRRTMILGILLGMVTTVVAIGLFLIADVLIYEPLIHLNRTNTWGTTWDTSLLLLAVVLFTLNVLAFAYFAIVPVVIAGGMIGLILQRLAYYRHLNMQAILIVGAIIGFATGWATATFILPTISVAGQWQPSGDPVWMGMLGALTGLFHSWLLSGWLRRRG